MAFFLTKNKQNAAILGYISLPNNLDAKTSNIKSKIVFKKCTFLRAFFNMETVLPTAYSHKWREN